MKFFFDELVTQSAYIWPRILQYNAKSCGKLAFLEELPKTLASNLTPWLEKLPDSRREALPITPSFFWDFNENSRKLALLTDRELIKLIRLAGVALHSKDLVKVVLRKEYLALRDILGQDLLDYAKFLGQYQVGRASELFVHRDLELSLGLRSSLHGWLAVTLCSLEWPKELSLKFYEQLDRLWAEFMVNDLSKPWTSSPKKLAKPAWETLWRFLQRCILCEVVPAWAPYFKK